MSLRQSGRWDSSGNFTIDSSAALTRLSQYGLPRPELFAVKLLQWAIESGAEHIWIRQIPGELELRHDGAPGDLSKLLDTHRIGPLHFAVAGVVGVPKASILVEAGSVRGRFGSGKVSFESCQEATSRALVQVTVPWLGILTRLGMAASFEPLTGSALREVARAAGFCPAVIIIQGRELHRPAFGAQLRFIDGYDEVHLVDGKQLVASGEFLVAERYCAYHHVAELRLEVSEGAGQVWLSPSVSTSLLESHGDRIEAAQPSLRRLWGGGIGLRLDHKSPSELLLVAGGILVDRVVVEEPAGLRCVVACDNLTFDATGLFPVRNLQFDRLVESTWSLGRSLKDWVKRTGDGPLQSSIIRMLGHDPEAWQLAQYRVASIRRGARRRIRSWRSRNRT